MNRVNRLLASTVLTLLCTLAEAQGFFNLTASEVRIDSLLPVFTYSHPLAGHYADSTYSVVIEYPEFIDMSEADISRYQKISDAPLPTMPVVSQTIGVSRRQGVLSAEFVPLVCRGGKYQKLVSFKLTVKAAPKAGRYLTRAGETPASRYADHSVLQSGKWVKIRVAETGIHQLTASFVRSCGFTDLSRVKVYGYGGGLQPESLTGAYLAETDDLKEVPTCEVGGRKLFLAVGPVTWDSETATRRQRNPYSNYGYYFLTDAGDEAPQTLSEEDFLAANYPVPADYHSLYEVDDYAWFHGGRNLFGKTVFTLDSPQTYTLPASSSDGTLTVALSYDNYFEATITVNDSTVGKAVVSASTINASIRARKDTIDFTDEYAKAALHVWTFPVSSGLTASNTIKITQTSGGTVRLDYVALTSTAPVARPDLSAGTFATPEMVYAITNQDHHADTPVDMVIIIPTSQKWLSEAERIKQLHESHDSLRVRIVPADELYNEFASGTPDANAYRRYLKMFYDRAETDADLPRYLLLFGDGAWDNRMLIPDWQGYDPDDFLLCYESENSFSEIYCYVSDDYYCLLDDEERIQQWRGSSQTYLGKPDVAVGRLSARSPEEARILVDKIVGYANNDHAGTWQNVLCFMGDDGNNNSHMNTADKVATMAETNYPSYNLKKIYWDAYTRTTSSTGNAYPDVTTLVRNQMQDGALIMNYCGHGAAYTLSHENVVGLADFGLSANGHLPLWITASCDIMPFDGQDENIGETAMMNKRGGAIAFFGTTRTVYSNYNEVMNLAFTNYVLGSTNGKRNSIGEAVRLAKCELVEKGRDTTPNKLQYSLLGDPALVLASPTLEVVLDSINGQALSSGAEASLAAGTVARISGHVASGQSVDEAFSGVVTAYVRDAEERIVCRLNDASEADTAFVYRDRTKVIYNGADSIRNGRFTVNFAVPKDIKYTDGTGLVTFYALNNDRTYTAHGENGQFMLNGSSISSSDGTGPSIYCYLNSRSFTNGGKVHTRPYFVAELYDDDGINASGSSVGHDLELIIDGDFAKTYNLNSSFAYDFGDYRSGTLGFSIPELSYGQHTLLFRAWDVLNNSSTCELNFEVSKGISPNCIDVSCTRNPATSVTTFIITHDRAGCELDVQLDVFDASGRQLWRHTETGTPYDDTYTFDWDLCADGGRPLQTGVYIYRVSISCDGSSQSSKARKLIITR